ncbi:dihydrofolate reductase [Leifsonia sp. LS1]|uniref:dihydrofolate reductase family protein n=1 Tax=Leifsonia sp. LS1 TaxID=2828483 RepID=UPI001CFD6F31|nr:dihydrofolate reductase family protein [Leifsonia sp. LS1]GIT79625.1 dihydrofolate reductase [Leifsonia sp. LS1]
MRRLVVTEFLSLDGVVEAPGGERTHPHSGWTFPFATEDLQATKLQEVRDAGSLLLGRRTYEQFVEAWPPREGEFADRMNSLRKAVVTSRPGALAWNAERLDSAASGSVRSAIAALKEADGDDDGAILVAGSPTLVRALIVWGLVDELRLLVYPVLLGGGQRIFPDDRTTWTFELAGLDRFDSGAVLHVYRLAGS